MPLKLIKLKDAAALIGYSDARSAESWCMIHKVKVRIENGRKFVFESDVDSALDFLYIKGLEESYPDNFQEIYQAEKDGDNLLVYSLKSKVSHDNSISSTYSPVGSASQSFLNQINQ